MRLPSRTASSTSQAQIGERADDGESTNTTVSASRMRAPRRVFQSSPPEMPCRSIVVAKAGESQSRVELVREIEIVAAVGDEDVELVALLGRLGHRPPPTM